MVLYIKVTIFCIIHIGKYFELRQKDVKLNSEFYSNGRDENASTSQFLAFLRLGMREQCVDYSQTESLIRAK